MARQALRLAIKRGCRSPRAEAPASPFRTQPRTPEPESAFRPSDDRDLLLASLGWVRNVGAGASAAHEPPHLASRLAEALAPTFLTTGHRDPMRAAAWRPA